MDRLKLDGFVYPAIQMPPVDETMPQDHKLGTGPHSATDWVNMIGVPAITVPGGFYGDELPFGIEFSARPWRDGDLISWAYDMSVSTRGACRGRSSDCGRATNGFDRRPSVRPSGVRVAAARTMLSEGMIG